MSRCCTRLLDKVTGLNEQSLCAAFELVKYDVALRQGAAAFVPTEAKAPPKEVLLATAIMIQRTIAFFHAYEMRSERFYDGRRISPDW